MKRRAFIHVSGAGAAFGAALGTAKAQEVQPALATLAQGQAAVMAPRHDGVEIVWRVNGLTKGYVEFGKTDKLGELAHSDAWGLRPAGKQVLRVRLDGLEPGGTYHYRTVTESFDQKNPKVEKGAIRTFKTLNPTAATTIFSLWNDTHQHDDTIRKLQSLTPASDFLFWNGDTCNDWHREGEVASTLITPAGDVDHTAKSPLFIIRGNHDFRGTLAHEVEDIAAMPNGKPWYAFRTGPVAAICMDTGEDKPDNHPNLFGRVACEPMRREQAAWLEKIIEQPEFKNAPYRVLICHIPLRWTNESADYGYDHFSKRSRDLWHDSLVKWGAQVVVSGHIHQENFIAPDANFPYAQIIGGGPKMNQARVITAKADGKSLVFSQTDMSGKETSSHPFKPLA